METTTITPYTTEWFKTRLGNFTASEVHRLMTEPKSKKEQFSKGAMTYILEKVHERLTGQSKQSFDTIATTWGVENEGLAIFNFIKRTGIKVETAKYFVHPDMPKVGCTPDGLSEDGGVVEVKCPFNGVNHIEHCTIQDEASFKETAKEYYWQMQHQMLVTGRKFGYFISFDPRINSEMGLFSIKINAVESDQLLLDTKLNLACMLADEFVKKFS